MNESVERADEPTRDASRAATPTGSGPDSSLWRNADAISHQWLRVMSLERLVEQQLREVYCLQTYVDVVALGKASREMAAAVHSVLGDNVLRRLIVSEHVGDELDPEVMIGQHPIPDQGSLDAGQRLVEFLDTPSPAACTIFLLSGGASSLCVRPAPPIQLDDLRRVWSAALASGLDITTLNKIRAICSEIAGGAILRHVGTERSLALIMVDNVVSGAAWVASALTFDYQPVDQEVTSLIAEIGLSDTALGDKILEAFEHRRVAMLRPVRTRHENLTIAEPSMLLGHCVREAQRVGYRVVDMGSSVRGDVRAVAAAWCEVIGQELRRNDAYCLIGVGEITIQVRGSGRGGRCQEFSLSLCDVLATVDRDYVFIARASDGRDFLQGVGGAWVDNSTKARAIALGINWSGAIDNNDSFQVLSAVKQLLDGGHSGWNLCDLYVACFSAPTS